MRRERELLRQLQIERERLRAAEAEIDQLRLLLGVRRDRQVTAFVKLLDRILLGAGDRGERMARFAKQVAARFEMQPSYLPDLEIAARLHELGRVVMLRQKGVQICRSVDENDWEYARFTKGILEQIDGLGGAAGLVGSIYENWDGSGVPHHLSKGQIPLRCRILRVLIDMSSAFDGHPDLSLEEILDLLSEHCGTLYDPMVFAHASQIVLNEQDATGGYRSCVCIPVTDLSPGMVLAEDLYADSGIKLLARDTTLTPGAIEAILRRHRFDPIVEGVSIRNPESPRRAG